MKDIFLVDLDETLLDFPRAERENFHAVFARFAALPAGAYERFHVINDGLWKLLERGEIAREVLKVRRFQLLFEEFGIRADAEAVARAYMDGFPEVCYPYGGTADFLQTLSKKGRVYIATNGSSAIQRRHIELAGFLPYLAGVFISEEVGANKPSQAYVEYLRSHIPAFEKARAVFLGDSPTSDMVCAKRLEADFVLYAPQGAPAGYSGPCARSYREALALMGASD